MKSRSMKALGSICALIILTSCVTGQGIVHTAMSDGENGSVRQDWFNADIRALPISGNPEALIRIANELSVSYATFGQKAYALRLAAHAHGIDRKNVQIATALSRIAFLAADAVEDEDTMKKNAEIGMKAARVAGIDESNPEACYYFALNQGLLVRSAGLLALGRIPEIFESLKIAQQVGHLDHGGPLRVLGMLYIKAPAWPSGIGDLDKALEVLEMASESFPSHPLNHLFYAEALIQDDNREQALGLLETAHRLAVPEIWGRHYSARWRDEIDQLKNKASR